MLLFPTLDVCEWLKFVASVALAFSAFYMVFHKKGPLFVFFIIHSNDDQFIQNFYRL